MVTNDPEKNLAIRELRRGKRVHDEPASSQKVVKLDLHAACDAGVYYEGAFADLSTKRQFVKYYRRASDDFDREIQDIDFAQCEADALCLEEVVFGMRGNWWYEFCIVVDPDTDKALDDQTDGFDVPFGKKHASSQTATPLARCAGVPIPPPEPPPAHLLIEAGLPAPQATPPPTAPAPPPAPNPAADNASSQPTSPAAPVADADQAPSQHVVPGGPTNSAAPTSKYGMMGSKKRCIHTGVWWKGFSIQNIYWNVRKSSVAII